MALYQNGVSTFAFNVTLSIDEGGLMVLLLAKVLFDTDLKMRDLR